MPVAGGAANPFEGISREAAWMSGYDAAQPNPMRAPVFWPDMDTRMELDSWSREEITRQSRWLYANTGLIGGLVDNSADLIGWQRPGVLNADPEYVLRANEVIGARMDQPDLFDRDGNFDLEDCQPMLSRCRMKDADAIVVKTRAQDGGARFAFYESHQLCDPKNASSAWRDGVRYDKGRRVAYGLRDPESGKVTVVEAKHVFYFGELKSPGHGRAVPPLARAITNGLDITEVNGFLKAALKSLSLFGAVIQQKTEAVPAGMRGMGGAPAQVTNAKGEKFTVNRVFSPGQIPELDPGRELKTVTDDRPSPEAMAFLRNRVRDIAVGWGLPPEVILDIIDLTGPGMRFVMDVADRWIRGRHKLQRRFVRWAIFDILGCEIDAGRLAISETDRAWWKLKMVPLRSLTIDRGQVSRARLDEIDAGVGTWEGWEEIDGIPWQDRFDQRAREVAYGKKTVIEIGKEYDVELSYEEVVKPRQGAAVKESGEREGEDEKKGKGAK